MRQQNASSIKAAAAMVKVPNTNPARKPPAFQPTVDNVTVFEDYTSLSAEGKFARVPYLVGHNDNEAGFYKIAAYAQGANLTEAQWQQFNNDTFSCPTSQEATNHVRAGVPTWRFRYYADWDNTRLYPTSGAYHGVDMNMIFGASEDVTGLPESQPQLQLQSTMQAAWASFVSDPAEGLTKFGWPVFDPNGNTLIRLGYLNDPTPSFINPAVYDTVCAALDSTS
ncbi:hypothetical protein VTN77DRAFT_8776 [Rasamsonia byssochlamydoides]|uniref:uncharacterized protein n=1 Tax=Rasamsonia byssochlamydoides TaxID=89139 RepID=UPI0037423288